MNTRDNCFHPALPLSALFTLPEEIKQAGYRLEQAFYTAMSMDLSYWKTLLTLQAGHQAKTEYRLCRELERTWFLVESLSNTGSAFHKADTELTAGLVEHVLYYHPQQSILPADCFHAKMAFLSYTSDVYPQCRYYRVGILSKNLTHDGDFQNICVLDGMAGTEETANGQRLRAYLAYCLANASSEQDVRLAPPAKFTEALKAFEDIVNIVLPTNCSVFFNGLDVPGILEQNGSCLWDVLMKQPQELQIVTKSLFIDPAGDYWTKLAQPNGISVRNCLQEDHTDRTHMKLYWRKTAETPKSCELWLGSANFSSAALGRFANGRAYTRGTKPVVYGPNVECLVRIQGLNEAEKTQLETVLQSTTPAHAAMIAPPPKQEEPSNSRSPEIMALRAIKATHQFSYKNVQQGKSSCYQLTCLQKGSSASVDLNTLQEYRDPSGMLWYWMAVPQSCFCNDCCTRNLNLPPFRAMDVAVLSLWQKTADNPESDTFECCRWGYLCPEGLPSADLQKAGKRLEQNLITYITQTPWVEKMLSASTEEKRQKVFDKWHTAVEEMEALDPAIRELHRPFLQTILSFEFAFRTQRAERSKSPKIIGEMLQHVFDEELYELYAGSLQDELEYAASSVQQERMQAEKALREGILQRTAAHLEKMDAHRAVLLEWETFAAMLQTEALATEGDENG